MARTCIPTHTLFFWFCWFGVFNLKQPVLDVKLQIIVFKAKRSVQVYYIYFFTRYLAEQELWEEHSSRA